MHRYPDEPPAATTSVQFVSDDAVLAERADMLGAAQACARDVATFCAPRSLAGIAQQVFDDLDATFEESLQRSYGLVDATIGSPDLREGVMSFLEKRPPQFAPLSKEDR